MSNENVEEVVESEEILCSQCNESVLTDGNTNETEDDGLVCNKCFEDFSPCYVCNEVVHHDSGNNDCNGDFFCESCYSDLPYCDHCEETQHGMDTTEVFLGRTSEYWCDSCRDEHSFWCERCNDNYSCSHNSSTTVSGNVLCERCFENCEAFECASCGRFREGDELANPDDDSEDWICDNCARNGTMKHIKSYGYKPNPVFHRTENDKHNDLFFGIELEVERNKSATSIGHMSEAILNEAHYYFKKDGSLNDGFEIVTHPMTFSYIQANKDKVFKDMLNKLIEAEYRSYDSTSCGIHIHLSKKAFGTWQLYRFIKFFIDNKEFVTNISQRKRDLLERWAAIDEEKDDAIIYKAKKKAGNYKRYVAVNLQNSSSVEIRIFRGTLNYQSFLKNIEFCYALYNFTRDSKDTSLEAFKNYIDNSNEYSMLKKFIKLKNL